jgi:hypothetical protein
VVRESQISLVHNRTSVIDFKKHIEKVEAAHSVRNPSPGKNCVDKIGEQLWRDEVMPALDKISSESADELQKQTGRSYPKDSRLKDKGNYVAVKSVEELQKATGKLDPDTLLLKDGNGNFIGVRRNLKYSEAPPTRLLSMTLILCYWLGFLDASGNHELHPGAIGAWDRIKKAYDSGKASHPHS